MNSGIVEIYQSTANIPLLASPTSALLMASTGWALVGAPVFSKILFSET